MTRIAIPEGLQSKACVVGTGALEEIPALLRECWPNDTRPVRMVADGNTWAAAGEKVHSLLRAAGIPLAEPYIFPAKPVLHAEYRGIEALRPVLKGTRPLAVGGGTINDLVKRTAEEMECGGYLCCATACSVDGYTSYGAAIVKDGLKQTLPCAAPLAVVADSAVVRTAPFEMTAAGYADLAAKVPAGADWILADAEGSAPFHPVAWGMVQTDLRSWLDAPEALKAGDPARASALFHGLCQTGFAMQVMHDSRPVSGAEHLYSHVWEMQDIRKDGVQPSHGFKVALGSLITTALFEEVFLNTTTQELRALAEAPEAMTRERRLAEIRRCLGGTAFEDGATKVAMAKLPLGDARRARQARLFEVHASIGGRLRAQLLPFAELRRRFALLGCPVEFADVGLTRDALLPATCAAGMIRNRYTILDVLSDLGVAEHYCGRLARYFQ